MKKDRISVFIQAILYFISLVLFKIFFRFKVEGQENLNGLEKSPIIFASNHNSYLDGVFAAISLPRSSFWPKNFFPIRFLGIDRFFSWRYFPINIIYKLGGVIKITRAKIKKLDNSHLFEVLSVPIKLLKDGAKIWIYPEGGFNDDGTPKKPRNGAAFLHQQTGAPIMPVKIIGNDKAMSKILPFLPSIKTLLRLNRIKIIFGKPIYEINNSNLDEATSLIMEEIYKL